VARHCSGSVDWPSCVAELIRSGLTLVETVGCVVLRTSPGAGICCSDQLRKRRIERLVRCAVGKSGFAKEERGQARKLARKAARDVECVTARIRRLVGAIALMIRSRRAGPIL